MPKLFAVLGGTVSDNKRPESLPAALAKALEPYIATLTIVKACGGGHPHTMGWAQGEGNQHPLIQT